MQENAIDFNRLYKSLIGLDVHNGVNLPRKPAAYIGLEIRAVELEATNTDSLLVFCQAGRSKLQFFDAEHQLSVNRRRANLPEHYRTSRSRSAAGAEFTRQKVMDAEGGRRTAA